MIIPENLAPLPVVPRDEEDDSAAPALWAEGDDFVLSRDVYQVVLGNKARTPQPPRQELPVEILAAEDFDSFAGRSDVALPPRYSPFVGLIDSRPVHPGPAIMTSIRPVFEPVVIRRPAPPRIVMDVEKEFGTVNRGGDRWWMLGVALAVGVITLSGTFVDFTSREAVRRAGLEKERLSAPAVVATPPAAPAETPVPLMEKQRAIAAAAQAADQPVR